MGHKEIGMKKIVKKLINKITANKANNPISIRFLSETIPINETQANDVFLVGFPKSGNTLMQHIIAHLVFGLNKNGSRSLISLLAPDIYTNTHYFRFGEVSFFKSHELPKPQYRRVIYIMRDGREALLSYYYMMKNIGQEIPLEDLYTGKHKIFGVNWHEHIAKWEENPYNAEILWLKYEELKLNKLEALNRICSFINAKRTKDELIETIKFTSFDYMKSLEQRSDWKSIKKNIFLKGKLFVRKGSIDSFKKEVPKELISEFESVNKAILDKHYNN